MSLVTGGVQSGSHFEVSVDAEYEYLVGRCPTVDGLEHITVRVGLKGKTVEGKGGPKCSYTREAKIKRNKKRALI